MIVRQYAPCSLGRSIICLGKQGEINALRVEFDVSAWMAMYPDATVKLMHFAPDRPQDNPVIPTLGVEGTLRVWIVGEEDTAGAGNGVIELLLIDERTGSTIKSATGYTTVLRSPSAGIEAQEAEAGYVRYDIDQSALLTDEQKAVARKNIGAGTGDGTGSGGILKETDPTVPDWAKQPRKPTYTASEVGARPDTWTPSASDVGADAAGTASGAVAAHNVSGAAHADLRALIEGLNSRLNALADSDDTTLDQLSEIVAYIKSNKALIDAVTTGKVSVSDIVDNLTTNASGKVLSAAQGVALKAMIDGIVIPTALPNPQPITINGQRYDGSEEVTLTVNSEGGGTPVEIDDTLTQSGKAADAKAVGDRLNELNEANAQQDERLTTLENASGIVTVEPADGDIPKVFIDGEIPTSKTDVLAEMTYISKSKEFHAFLKIKCQGTSSMSYPKKNFTVKLYTDGARSVEMPMMMRNWGVESSKYVLKANYVDHSHARNIVDANLWSGIVASRADYASLPEELRSSPNNGAVDGFPIKVYTNGTYQGIYTWNIGKDAWMWGMDEENANHVLLCSETNTDGTYAENASNFRALWNGVDGTNWSVEVGTNSTAVKDSLNALISCVKDTTDDEFRAQIGNHLDLQSAIDYYIHCYADCGLDSLAKNMLLGTYDLVKWYMGRYDMDSVWGLYWNGSKFVAATYRCPEDYQEQFSLLWERLEALYYNEIKARYAELRAGALSLPNIVTKFERFMDVIGLDLYAEDLTIYTGIPQGSTNNIKQIRNYVRDRLAYVDEQIAALDAPAEEIPCTGITLDQTTLTFDGAGTQTLTATVTPSNTTDTVVWTSDDPSIASVSGGVVTAKANGSATITATCGAYSSTCTVSVSGFSSGSDISDVKPLSDGLTWTVGYKYDNTTGELVEATSENASNRFTVDEDAVYIFKYSGSYPRIMLWKADGEYVGYNEGSSVFSLIPGYIYAVKVYNASFDASAHSLIKRANSVAASTIDFSQATADDFKVITGGFEYTTSLSSICVPENIRSMSEFAVFGANLSASGNSYVFGENSIAKPLYYVSTTWRVIQIAHRSWTTAEEVAQYMRDNSVVIRINAN